jgi:hypothetical protein
MGISSSSSSSSMLKSIRLKICLQKVSRKYSSEDFARVKECVTRCVGTCSKKKTFSIKLTITQSDFIFVFDEGDM